MKEFDYLIVGAGFAGATAANLLAREGKKILLIDKNDHIGGNMYDYFDTNGVLVHKYGPHIFHTNYLEVYEYLKSFDEFFEYKHRVLGNIDGVLVPIPFNFTSLEKLLPEKAESLKNVLKKEYPDKTRVSILDLINNKNKDIHEFGEYVLEKVFVHYTAKQWGTTIDKVDSSVINRVPVVLGYDDLYFSDKYQFMPVNGFTPIFNKMLESDNITIMLNTPVEKVLKLENGKTFLFDAEFAGKIIYTGAIDELFNNCFGRLPYRSLDLRFERLDMTYYQPAAVVNYTVSEDFTRITEFKYLANQHIDGHTTILREYSQKYDGTNTPYYPIQNEENIAQYNRYKDLANSYKNLYLCGRLAEYKYYNMDAVIKKAFELVEKIKNI